MAKLTTKQKAGIGLGIFGLITVVAATRAKAVPLEYCCPYCDICFATYEELVDHVRDVHPGERIPLPIEWD